MLHTIKLQIFLTYLQIAKFKDAARVQIVFDSSFLDRLLTRCGINCLKKNPNNLQLFVIFRRGPSTDWNLCGLKHSLGQFMCALTYTVPLEKQEKTPSRDLWDVPNHIFRCGFS